MTDSKKTKRRWGDRRDGRLVRTLPAMHKIEPFIMVTRNDACNQFTDRFEVTKAEEYIRAKRAAGMKDFTMLHLLVAAYVRTCSQKPGINRFVAGQRVYTRDQVEVNLCIKKEMRADSPDSVLSILIDPAATADEIYRILTDEIEKTRNADTSFDDTAALFNRLPRLVKKFVFWLLRTLDYFGLLPYALTRLSPFHGSLFITSMASIGLPPIYHHIYNFGNVPVFIAFGITEKGYVLQKDGTTQERRYMHYSVVMDERVCDGYYFASAFRYLSGLMRNPAKLDEPIEPLRDVD